MQHISFIMDGNRTWAKSQGLSTFDGHKQGYENAKTIIRHIRSRGDIGYMSLWALSDDNIAKRSKDEVTYLFRLLTLGMKEIARDAKKQNIRVVVIGNRELLPEDCRKSIEKAEKSTEHCTSMTAIVAIGYGGQDEIVRGVQRMIASGNIPQKITQEYITQYMETSAFPPPDLIVRTGGHLRHSGFFLFMSPYAEYEFLQKNWPEVTTHDVDYVIEKYSNRIRKFGA